jgi:hypothetical protein
MGYRPQTGSRRGSGQKFQKSQHEKAKAKAEKRKSGGKYVEEAPVPSTQEILERTLTSLSRLGIQTFAVSPFSQYFDDWLVNLREVLAEFESNPAIAADEAFVKERTQILTDVERELAEKRIREAKLEESAKVLAEENHRLVDIDAKYATQVRGTGQKRNSEIQRLTKNVHDLEEELDRVTKMKTSFFGFTKKAKAKKESEVRQKQDVAKKELELAAQNFAVEQEKLHDEYEKQKQVTIEKVQALEKEVEALETDSSVSARQTACNALAEALKNLLKRMPSQAQSS